MEQRYSGPVSVRVEPGTLLSGDIDDVAIWSSVPEEFRVKGLFFKRSTTVLGDDMERIRQELREPTERYLPFRDYSAADHGRLAVLAARKQHPRVSDREAVRRFARQDMDDFATSVLGKVMLSLVGDPQKALSLYAQVYAKVAPGPWGVSQEQTDEGWLVEFRNHPGDWAYQIGQLEGIIGYYGEQAVVTVDVEPPRIRYRLSWL